MLNFLSALFWSLSPLWEMSVTAAYAAAVVILLRLMLKKWAPKQVLCLLWLVVFARLVIPVLLESPLSIVPNALPGQEHTAEQTPADPVTGDPTTPNVPQNTVQNQPQNQPGNGTATPAVSNQNPSRSIPEGVSPAAPTPEAPAAFPWQAVIAGVWLTGAAALGGYALVSWLRLRRRLFDAIRAKDGAWEHLAVDSPFILGVFRPRIYLPAGLTGRPRRFILCHERAHLRRLDHIVKPVCWAALALHWFNPLVWAAFLLMSRDIESACDEAVVRQLGSRVKADYSYTLLALAAGRRFPAPCPLAFDEGDTKGRIRNVLNYRRPALWVIIISAVAAALAAVCLLTDPVAAKMEGDPGTATSQSPNESADIQMDPWMKEVLDGEREFLMDDGKGNLTVDQLFEAIYGIDLDFQLRVTVSKVAIIDLDRDGINELVVWPSINGDDSLGAVSAPGYLILRRQGDTVYGYNPNYRDFNQLKADGTFGWSNSAFNHGTGSARFTENGFEVKDITWCDISTDMDSLGDAHFFVDGRKATSEEFEAALSAQDAKPEAAWYFYRDGALSVERPTYVNTDDYDFTVPDFLNKEQRALYAQALNLYSRLFGPNSEIGNPNSNGTVEYVEYNGRGYYPTDAHGSWDEFEQTVLSVFTSNFWITRNKDDLYVNIDGTVHYQPYARGSGGYNESFPETFRLVEQTDDTISFIMTGYYSDSWFVGWEYSIEFPMRMVRTADGWRFDEFRAARSDNGVYPFYEQHIPNPDAPLYPSADPYAIDDAAPLDAPVVDWDEIPEDPNQWYKVAELPDDMIWMFSRNRGAETLLRWDGSFYEGFNHTAHTPLGIMPELKKLGGTDTYGPLAVISNVGNGTGMFIDELVVYDLDSAGPVDYTHDWKTLRDDFNENVSFQYDQNTRTLTYTYRGQTVEAVIDANDEEAYLRMEHDYPDGLNQEDIRLCTGEFVYYRFDLANDGDIVIELTVEMFAGNDMVPLLLPGWVSWTLRFNGHDFDAVPESCVLGYPGYGV